VERIFLREKTDGEYERGGIVERRLLCERKSGGFTLIRIIGIGKMLGTSTGSFEPGPKGAYDAALQSSNPTEDVSKPEVAEGHPLF
jgi:hypothetical protein